MTLKVAVIGVGEMGRNHARVYSEMPDVELVGLADVNAQAVQNIARRYGTRSYTDYIQLLDEQQPDAVTLAVPTVDHLDVARHVIARKIHLLVEKPIAADVEQGRAMIAAADKAGVRLMVGHIERFNPAVIALKAYLNNGELGGCFRRRSVGAFAGLRCGGGDGGAQAVSRPRSGGAQASVANADPD